ncbi:MAG: hypothetical protein K5897_00810 [Eubacterium sp.]|nr:hypothetical protein [Eubacterium sp.]
MAKKNYTEEEKKIALAKAAEIGVRKAAAELSIPWQTLAVWVRKEKSAAPAAAKTETAEKTDKKEAAPKKRGRKPAVKAEETKKAETKKPAPKKPVEKKAAPKKPVEKKATEKKPAPKKAAVKKTAVKKTAAAPAAKAAETKQTVLTTAKQEKLIADNAVLRAEIAALKEENVSLKKALRELLK